MAKNITDDFLSKVKVRVDKKQPDDRTSLCGEPVQTDEEGRQFFIIPAHQADYIKDTFSYYEVGEQFIEEKGTPKKTGRPRKEEKEKEETEE